MRSALRCFLSMTILTGILYPLLITCIAQLFSESAHGSLVKDKGKIIGSVLIGQNFTSDHYFWGRPSASNYNALSSGGSNLGPTSAALESLVEERKVKVARAHGVNKESVPSELLFASGSGLDPHISLATAYFQVDRIARARKIDRETIVSCIDGLAVPSLFSPFDDSYVNVFLLNRALDEVVSK